MDGVMESACVCLGGWIRSLGRRRIRSDAEWRLKQGIMEEGRRGAEEEEAETKRADGRKRRRREMI